MLVTYAITADEMDCQKPVKQYGKKIVKSKVGLQTNQWCETESSELSQLQEINKTKKIVKREKYVTQFKRSEVSLLIKARSRILNLKNNFKWQFTGDVSCPRCDLRIDDENHLFTSSAKLEDLYGKYQIHRFQDWGK